MSGVVPTVEHVREIIDTQLSDEQIEGILASAITLVSSRLEGKGLDGSLLIEIQRWVCAHDVSIRDRSCVAIEEKIGESEVRYPYLSSPYKKNGTVGLLMTSAWGMRACSLDPTGTLYNLGGPPTAIFSLNVPSLSRSV